MSAILQLSIFQNLTPIPYKQRAFRDFYDCKVFP